GESFSMKRNKTAISTASMIPLAIGLAAAITSKQPPAGLKKSVKCPATLNSIRDCPKTGCGNSLDPNLNKQKNITTDNEPAVKETIKGLASLPDPVPGFNIGDKRDSLTELGESQKITVVAFALIARKGSKESCNCGLSAVDDTDNHIVLVDPSIKNP